MRIRIDFGREHFEVEARENQVIAVRRQPPAPALADPADAVRLSLETPLHFPALRQALTPDDHVALVIDETLPPCPGLLAPILEHVASAGVSRNALTLVFATAASQQLWCEPLPETLAHLARELHDPQERKRLAYLATTKAGRRIYLNRTVVDADQAVVLTRRGYDPLLGYAGATGALYPALSDEATLQELSDQMSLDVPTDTPWPSRAEAIEVAWLLGAPFFVQLVEGPGDDIAHVVSGLGDACAAAERLLDDRWRVSLERSADLVVAGVSGDPAQHDFRHLARALACAGRVVKPGGRIALLSRAAQATGPGLDTIRQADTPEQALSRLREQRPCDLSAAFQWLSAAQQASVFLLSDFAPELAEELFTTPLEQPRQVQRLLDSAESCVFLPDAHKVMAAIQ